MTALRVAVLADTVAGRAGMGRYAREVLRGLAHRPDVDVVPVVPAEGLAAVEALDLGAHLVDVIEVPGRNRIEHGLWERYRLGGRLDRRGIDVVHGLKHIVPRTRRPTVLTVHDLILLTGPEQADLAKRLLLPRQYRASLRSARMLVANSEATARRLVEYDPSFAAKTIAAPLGFTPELLEVEPAPVPELVGQTFALVVGDLSPRKNIGFLVDIWPEVYAQAGHLRLAVVGPDGVRSGRTRRRIDDLVATGLAIRPGPVSDGSLRWCYEHARVVVMPTLEEGFGLPVLEAAVLGAPVVANPDPALVETGRGWPTFVDVTDRSGWIRAVVAASAGRDQSRAAFSGWQTWDAHIARLVEAYRLAVRNNS